MIHYDKVLSQSQIFSNSFQLYTEYVFLLQENYNVGLTEQLDPRSNRFPNSEITIEMSIREEKSVNVWKMENGR